MKQTARLQTEELHSSKRRLEAAGAMDQGAEEKTFDPAFEYTDDFDMVCTTSEDVTGSKSVSQHGNKVDAAE